ncbi:hypothetical protein KMI_10g16740 [Encephalitozoon hellem]|uniref:Uncharacterized protein n=1 Tax=Encephalitozoon hellem TaxID=27973 RepID=A0A9Q9F7I6_ENCHE|nr:uncharacterized protein EHEL_011285 [Encephalitozoon hellem ATCC 50504]AHL28904.1 hypothetical protein EHEL_011285 [Encephalitozoon hellem ATCC 50504]KAG5858974.1 hypothetical protein KMI_10g16740 [Encephalitozoon hellem]UTX42444.1 hypothetical protein GPU96_01g01480 [Encephalitozoon hellem]WEL37887.1 hypothetical protein PFJ87_01g01410 [Encephalitozoon hellem]
MDEKLKEMVDASTFAEKELKAILGEINLQNERLVDIQRKIGLTRGHLQKNSKLIGEILKVTKPKLAIGIIILSIMFIFLVYVKLIFPN